MSLILDLVFPKTCSGCGASGYYFCPNCICKTEIKPVQYLDNGPIEACLSIFKYQSSIKKLIHDLKYNFITDIVSELTDISFNALSKNFPHIIEYWHQNQFILTPIPLHYFRKNWRGFNQSEILGEAISQKLGLAYRQDVLTRSLNNKSQVQTEKLKRAQNIKNAFEINQGLNNIPQNIILFDDVATTRSTLNSAATALRTYGLNRCWYLTVAG